LPDIDNIGGIEVALLTGGADKPYAFGLTMALLSGVSVLDVIGNDELDCPEFRASPKVRFLNLRGDQRPNVGFISKAIRVMKYYIRLLRYSVSARPDIFHILWNNKFEYFDRTLLMLWYKLLGKKTVLTLHNINGRKRDQTDSTLNHITLRIQYGLARHMFVHTEKMKDDLMTEFAIPARKVTVIPFGINNSVPVTKITGKEARNRLNLASQDKTILFFGNIAPYKGLEYLVRAFKQTANDHSNYKLIIAGRPKNCDTYWSAIRREIDDEVKDGRILVRDEFIADEDIELYMKAADVLVLPYRYIYQSGVLFLGYSFGLPALVSDVGSLRNDVIEGKTGFVFQPENPEDLGRSLDCYFSSEIYSDLDNRRAVIREYAWARNSWDIVARATLEIYSNLSRSSAGIAASENRASAATNVRTS
jgi:D-inositol-3-phosphate glycosyltransferase